MKKSMLWIIGSALLCALGMSVLDGVVQPTYAVKSALKITLFLLVPLLYFRRAPEGRAQLRALLTARRGTLRRALALGLGVFAVILGAYLLLRGRIDFSGIAAQLSGSVGVNRENFLLVALYISFVNSLLEEFFFRGYAFAALARVAPRAVAYGFSALLFALYHVGMTARWFHPAIFLLSMLGLAAGGCIFNWLNEKSGSLYPSWLVHMCANFAINTVGLIMFGIV